MGGICKPDEYAILISIIISLVNNVKDPIDILLILVIIGIIWIFF